MGFEVILMFSHRLKRLREDFGLTQGELAKMLNLTQSTIAYYENGRKVPTLENAKIIAGIFNTSLDYLFGIPNNQPITNENKTASFSDKLSKDINNLSPESQKDLETFINFLKFRDMDGE